ncbi:hypothetical protein R82526_04487 [Ralstonia mannitolilytica]|nr:hypothetical protein R82526_04487 [Ralstonia mannitolilytica]CAJ0895067.1 hypothetical protein R76727_04587 [Ralstonia mannitolilytica]
MSLPAGDVGMAEPVESLAPPPYPGVAPRVLPDRPCRPVALRLRVASRLPLAVLPVAPVPVAVVPVAVESVAVAPAGGMPPPSTVLFDRAPAAWACATLAPPASASATMREEARKYVMNGSLE